MALLNEAINSEELTHILAIPFMLGYLIYRQRKMLVASSTWEHSITRAIGPLPIKDIFGILLCALAYSIKWYGSYTFLPLEYHITSLPIFITGLILILFNFETLRTIIFPIMFLYFLIPPPSRIIQMIGIQLSLFSSQASYAITKLLRFPVNLSLAYGNPIIFLTTSKGQEISLVVDIACSGLYSLIGFALFASFITYISRGNIKNKIITLISGFPLIYALNILRITILIIIGYYYGAELALNTFHLLGGWILILLGTTGLLVLSEKFLGIHFTTPNLDTCEKCSEELEENICSYCGRQYTTTKNKSSKSISEIIRMIIISATILSLTLIQVPVFAMTQTGAEISLFGSENKVPTTIFPEIEGYDLRFAYRDTAFENISGQDASLMYMYIPTDGEESVTWVGLEIGSTRASLHRWEGCLIDWPTFHGRQVRVVQLDLRDIQLLENPPLTARYFSFYWNSTDVGQVVLYWFTTSTIKTEDSYQEKIFKISVLKYPINPTDYKSIEEDLLPFAQAISKYWVPISSWSQTALMIAKNGQSLILIFTGLLFATICYAYYDDRMRMLKCKKIISNYSNPDELVFFKTIKSIQAPITLQKISDKLSELSEKSLNKSVIQEYLHAAEKEGIIVRRIVNKNDLPYVSWSLTC